MAEQWKAIAERLRLPDDINERRSWSDTVNELRKYFPGRTDAQIRETIRGHVRGLLKYKQQKAFENNERFQSIKSSVDYEKGTREYEDLIKIADCEDLTPEDIMAFHKLNPELWKVKQYTTNRWHGQVTGGDRITQYQSKLVVEPVKAGEITIQTAIKVFSELSSGYKPKPIQYQPHKVPMLLEVNIADLHLGKLAWRGECGEDYDFKIARERYECVIADIAYRAKGLGVEEIIFPVGNDTFNSDTTTDTTTAGTQQTNDLRWPKMYGIGCEIVTAGIDRLRKIAPIEVFDVVANHDKMLAFFLVNHISAFFRNTKGVTVNTSPLFRKYIEYHNTLIGFAHGAAEKKRINDLMQVEAREAWGRTKFHEFHVAHIHSEKADGPQKLIMEGGGVIVRAVSSVTGSDSWHAESGFVGAVKKAQNFLYDREKGLVEIINSVV